MNDDDDVCLRTLQEVGRQKDERLEEGRKGSGSGRRVKDGPQDLGHLCVAIADDLVRRVPDVALGGNHRADIQRNRASQRLCVDI
jgi:hypothetical protein